jgi:hypothetical protein
MLTTMNCSTKVTESHQLHKYTPTLHYNDYRAIGHALIKIASAQQIFAQIFISAKKIKLSVYFHTLFIIKV